MVYDLKFHTHFHIIITRIYIIASSNSLQQKYPLKVRTIPKKTTSHISPMRCGFKSPHHIKLAKTETRNFQSETLSFFGSLFFFPAPSLCLSRSLPVTCRRQIKMALGLMCMKLYRPKSNVQSGTGG